MEQSIARARRVTETAFALLFEDVSYLHRETLGSPNLQPEERQMSPFSRCPLRLHPLTPFLLFAAVLGFLRTPASEAAQVDLKTFVSQWYYEGMPYTESKSYGDQ